jgi:hypothetical protein
MLSLASVDQLHFSDDGDKRGHLQTNRIQDRQNNIVQLRQYRLDLAQKKAPTLHHALVYYEGLRRSPSKPPLRQDFDETVPLKLGLGDHANIAEVGADEIEKAWGRMQAGIHFPWIGRHGGARVADFPLKIYSDLIIHNLLILRETAMPQFGRVTVAFGKRLYDYWRLALPLSSDGERVDQVMTLVVNRFPDAYRRLD